HGKHFRGSSECAHRDRLFLPPHCPKGRGLSEPPRSNAQGRDMVLPRAQTRCPMPRRLRTVQGTSVAAATRVDPQDSQRTSLRPTDRNRPRSRAPFFPAEEPNASGFPERAADSRQPTGSAILSAEPAAILLSRIQGSFPSKTPRRNEMHS